MSVLSLALLAVAQTGPLKFPITAYELPQTGGMREMVLGPVPKEWQRLGLFYNKPVATSNLRLKRNVINYIEVQIGFADAVVKPGTIYGHPCRVIEAGGSTKQEIGPYKLTNTVKRWWYVDEATGKLWRDYCSISTASGTWTMNAVFHKDTFDVTLTTPEGEMKNPGVSGFDLSKLDAAFKPMIVEGKKVIDEKDFFLMNPVSGVPEPWKVDLVGRFASPITTHKATGNVAEIHGGGVLRKAFVSDKGDLFKVELPKERYLQFNPTTTFGG